jgi:TRAP-type mannitol/chloroaromatic compound transport system permease small subunit
MQMFLALSRAIDWINESIGKAVGWLILISIFVSAGNAVIRKIAPAYSSNAWLELQWYLYGAAFMMAAAYTLKQNEHIRIDILYGMWSRKAQHRIDLFGHIFFLLPFVALMVWLLIPYVTKSFHSGEHSSNSGGLILWPAKALLLIGFGQLLAQAFSEIVKKIAVMRGLIEDPTPFVSSHHAAEVEAEELMGEVKK